MSRAYCQQCLRPERACICHLVRNIPHQHAISILQHVNEVTQAKGTGVLSSLCLSNTELTAIDPAEQKWQLNANDAVLFPASDAIPISKENAPDISKQFQRFIALDGTWRQANQLQRALVSSGKQINFVSFADDIQTEYANLRKTKKAGALSTLESIYQLLALLEPDNVDLIQLMSVFNSFINFQQEFSKP